MAANHFLDLLPSDLQICVLQTWISGAKAVTLTLSALDVACCQKAIRPAVLALFRSLLPIGSEDEPIPVDDAMGFVLWLSARSLRAEALMLNKGCFGAGFEQHDLSSGSCVSLPSVKSVTVMLLPVGGERTVEELLRACPSLTAFRVLADNNGAPAIWDILTSLNCKLEALSLPHRCCSEMLHCLQTIGHALRKLEVFVRRLGMMTTVLSEHCPRLECLSIAGNVDADELITLLQSCRSLTELKLFDYRPTLQELDAVLTAGRGQLRKFETDLWGAELFPFVLESHPWLEHIKLGDSAFERSKSRLTLSFYDMRNNDRERICAACPRVLSLCLSPTLPSFFSDTSAKLLNSKYRDQLEELTLYECNADVFQCLIAGCQRLKRIRIVMPVDDLHLHWITKNCPRLTDLTLNSWSVRRRVRPSGLKELFRACKELKEITVDTQAHQQSLQENAESKERMSKLRLLSRWR